MATFPIFEFAKKDVERAGKALAGSLIDSPDRREEYQQLFRVAHSWRNSHAYPMQRIKIELSSNVRRSRQPAIVSARMKRLTSIRRKLARSTTKLSQMQDLGGCRAIVDTVDQLNSIIGRYRDGGSAHAILRDTSYIEVPRQSGYRSHHFVLGFTAQAHEAGYDGRQIELQLRTKLQHVWATAVETVGMARDEDLKSGEGDTGWLRLFALMASEFANEEGLPIVLATPEDPAARKREIISLSGELDAVAYLSSINNSIEIMDMLSGNPKYIVIQYDKISEHIRIRGFANAISASDFYFGQEGDKKSIKFCYG